MNWPDESLESVVEAAVDDEVHDAVEDEKQVVDGRGAEEPDGRHEVDAARDHVVHVEQLVQVEQQPRQVGHEEHAHDEDEEKGELKILGLERKKNYGDA